MIVPSKNEWVCPVLGTIMLQSQIEPPVQTNKYQLQIQDIFHKVGGKGRMELTGSAPYTLHFSVSSVWSYQLPKIQGFIFGPALSLWSSAWTIPWIFSAATTNHHLHTKLACPFCHLRSSVLKTSYLPSAFFHLLYHFFPFSTCCTLSFTDLLPCILLSAPALPSQIPTEPFQLVSAMLHTAEHL